MDYAAIAILAVLAFIAWLILWFKTGQWGAALGFFLWELYQKRRRRLRG